MPLDKILCETDHLRDLFARQKAAANVVLFPDHKTRLNRLNRVAQMLNQYEDRFTQAINMDFGQRSVQETQLSELMPARVALGKARSKLKGWMKPRNVATNLLFKPGKGQIVPQPLGVVGIIAPWNYPLQLTVCPLITALAAGNRVIIKPSELTPLFGEALRDAVATFFAPEEVAIVLGEVEVSQTLTTLPFDHIIFTGSTSVGRMVAQAAAKNLTPVTLELGGKSPAIIDDSFDLDTALRRIIKGKLFNAGQICVAPDYLIVPQGRVEEAVEKAIKIAREMYPTLAKNPDATAIISQGHYDRLQALVDDARDKGAQVTQASNGNQDAAEKMMPLTILTSLTDDMKAMQDEIFGPVLPILSAENLDDALRMVRSRGRPLALYWFGTDTARREVLLQNVHAGGVTINDTLLHVVQDNLPFGGVGPSGMGNYHGQDGFERLSHMKGVFFQSKHPGTDMLGAPYTDFVKRMIDMSMWWAKR